MKKKVKQLWVEAPRSGEYKQGANGLKMDDTFCCLGVLCDLHAKEKNKQWAEPKYQNFASYLGMTAVLPPEVQKWAGLDRANPVLKSPKHGFDEELSILNDGGATFQQIADVIEAQL